MMWISLVATGTPCKTHVPSREFSHSKGCDAPFFLNLHSAVDIYWWRPGS